MSFTDGKVWTATADDVKMSWGGERGGVRFRCRLCGHKFAVGDLARWVFSNTPASGVRYGNFLVCTSCDGEDVIKKAAAQEQEAKRRFWWFRGD